MKEGILAKLFGSGSHALLGAGAGKVAIAAVVAIVAVSGAVVVASDLNNDDNKANSNQGGSDQGGSKGDDSGDVDKTSYTITLLTDGDGDVTGGGTYEGGKTVTISAVGKNGQEFYQWSDGNTDATRTINVTTNLSLTAYFASFYDISASVSPDSAGTLTGADKHIRNGQSVTLTATAASGYKFSHWEEDGSSVSEESKYTFTVSKDRALVAVFEVDESGDVKTTYTITLNTSGNGTVTGANKYDEGTEITVTATATSGYKFSYWSENGNKVSEESSYTFTVSKDRALTAVFEKVQDDDDDDKGSTTATYTLTLIANGNGTVTGAGTYDEGTTVEISATGLKGQEFYQWDDGNTNATRRVTVTSDLSLTAYFARFYDVTATVSPSEAGALGAFDSHVRLGQSVTLTVSVNDGYTFKYWEENGSAVSTSTAYSIDVSDNHTLTAVFEKSTVVDTTKYTVTLTKNHDSAGSVSGSGSYAAGSYASLAATENEGYTFKGWYIGSNQLSSSTTYSYKVTGDVSIEAVYSIVHDATFTLNTDKPYINELITFKSNSVEGVKSTTWTLTSNNDSGLNLTDVAKSNESCSFKTADYADVKITRTVVYEDGETATYSTDLKVHLKEFTMTWKWRTQTLADPSEKIYHMTSGKVYKPNNRTSTYTGVISYESYQEYVNSSISRSITSKPATNPNNFITADDPVIQAFAAFIKKETEGMSDLDVVNCALKAAQSITYTRDPITHGVPDYTNYPIETLWEGEADCEDHSILFCSLANALGYRTVQYYIKCYEKDMYTQSGAHIAPGVIVPGASGKYTIVDGEKYYYAEATSCQAPYKDWNVSNVGYQSDTYKIFWAYKGTSDITKSAPKIKDVENGQDATIDGNMSDDVAGIDVQAVTNLGRGSRSASIA